MTELVGGVNVDEMVLGSMVRPVDRLGRPQPRILGAFGIINAAISAGAQSPVPVPANFWALDANSEGNSVAVVACPCRSEPRVEAGCLASCGCGRYYFFAIDRVLVFNSPKGRDASPSAELQSES